MHDLAAPHIDQHSYLIDVWRGKVEFPQLKQKVVELYHRFGCTHLLIEDQGSGQSLIQDLRVESAFNLIPRRSSLGKPARVDQASGAIQGGRVLFPEDAPWLAEFERELLPFPNAKHDDQVDSLTQFVMWLNERASESAFSYSFIDPYGTDMECLANHILTIRGWR